VLTNNSDYVIFSQNKRIYRKCQLKWLGENFIHIITIIILTGAPALGRALV